ncbi:MAG: hypothetical protein HFG14_11535 [Lachnospiraceae bacterium]|nr:hypothetical protein [Lachnospiraceae bacterium]
MNYKKQAGQKQIGRAFPHGAESALFPFVGNGILESFQRLHEVHIYSRTHPKSAYISGKKHGKSKKRLTLAEIVIS